MKKNIVIIIFSRYGGTFLIGISGILISRYLGVVQTGQLGFLQTIFTILGTFAGLGQISAGSTLMLSTNKAKWNYINNVSSIIYTLSSSLFILFIFTFFRQYIDQKLIFFCLSFSLISGSLDLFPLRWELEQNSKKVASFSLWSSFFTVFLRILGALFSLQLYYFCLLPGLTRILSFYIIYFSKIKKIMKEVFNKKHYSNFINQVKQVNYKEHFNLGLITGVESLLFNGAQRLDILMLRKFAQEPLTSIGIYVGANKYFTFAIPLAGIVTTAVAGNFIQKNNVTDRSNMIKFFEQKLPKFLFIIISISILIYIAAPILENLLGEDFKGVREVLIALSFGYLPFSLSIWFNKQIKISAISKKDYVIIPSIVIVINFLFNFYFIDKLRMGALGAAYATTISYWIKAFLLFMLISKYKSKFIKS